MEERKYKRRRYFINKNFQGKFILVYLFFATLGGMAALIMFNILSYRKLERIIYSVHLPANKLNEIIFSDLVYANMAAFLLTVLIFLIVMNRISIRLAGPLYRIKKDLERIAAGDLSFNIALRYRDEFKDFAEEMNKMVVKKRDLFKSVRDEIERIDTHVREAERHFPDRDMVSIKNEMILSRIDALKEKIRNRGS